MTRTSVLTMIPLLIVLGLPSLSGADYSSASQSINAFVESLYPKGSHFFWVINDTTTESQHEMVVDINTALQDEIHEQAKQQRFLLLIIHGELFAAQKIPLEANVNCKQEEQV
ncbi:MAG: hypothetical protein MRJ96_01600 [Nitrospirales bacterium]|nr:hypothetical protein [Nitrospira sp.]MDR4500138.1 hypothetical protein [Nitrospirales bacterium]